MSTKLLEILYTDSQDMLVISSTVASPTTIAVQMAAPVPEIIKHCFWDQLLGKLIQRSARGFLSKPQINM
jgi:hypothetical protein